MGDAGTALELWERSVKALEMSTRTVSAAVKTLQEANTTLAPSAWDAVEASRAAMRVAHEDESHKFEILLRAQSQTAMDLDEARSNGSTARQAPAPAPGLPQEPLRLAPHRSKAEEVDEDADVDDLVDEVEEAEEESEDEVEKSDDEKPEGAGV